jgi:sugar (pentulose or hexulose) kinase
MSGKIDHLTTLAGYVPLAVDGQKVLGVGEASGMFPIDSQTNTYDEAMLAGSTPASPGKKPPVAATGHPAQSSGRLASPPAF